MSAIADFRIIETSKLNELRENAQIKIEKRLFSKKVIDNYWDFLNANTTKLKDFDWSGYTFNNLLIFLEEKKGVDLLKGKYDDIANEIVEKRQNGTFILTFEHRQKYLDKLNPENYSEKELIDFNKNFSEEDDPELAKAEMEGIKALQDSLSLLKDDTKVVLLTIS
ncbi:MAG: hypothetical protein EBU52_01050 [Cytophagia bacterium]|nr:hypothetical protein [Cytophagia bacterium]